MTRVVDLSPPVTDGYRAGIPLVEGLVGLDALPRRCDFYAPFVKLAWIEAAPARAFAAIG